MLRLLEARARGRSLDQTRTLGFSPKSFDGVVAVALALGLVGGRDATPTEVGRSYLLAAERERQGILLHQIRAYPPYSLALDAVLLHGGPVPTTLEWLETWWAAHGFGSSESNRSEAAPVFAKLVDAAGLGRYIQGRKGHPSRIEWLAEAAELPPPPAHPDEAADPPAPVGTDAGSVERPLLASQPEPTEPAPPAGTVPGTNLLRWRLGPGRDVVLELPGDLTRPERERILQLLELLLRE